jgi:hypothetical protein
MENDIVLAEELLDMDARGLARLTGLKPGIVSRLKTQAEQICG